MSEKTAPQPEKDSGPIGEISQDPSAFEAFLDAHQKKLIIIGILAILGLVGYVIYDGLRKMADRNAAGDVDAARTVPEYDAVSKKHEGTNAGGSALIFKSQLLWRDQQQQEAITAIESFISDYPDHPALGNAYASLGSYHQQLGNLEDATTAFEKSAETKSSASSLALLSLGDLALNSGKGEEAQAFYDRIITEYETSHFQVKKMARDRIKLIGVNAPTDKVPEPPKPDLIPSVTSQPVTIPGLPGALKPKPDITEPKPTTTENPTEANDLGDLGELEVPKETTPPAETEAPKTTDSPESE